MIKRFNVKKQQLIRRFFGFFSFTSIMFVFQACYGMPPGEADLYFNGVVTSEQTGEPIPNIKVDLLTENGDEFSTLTNQEGGYYFRLPLYEEGRRNYKLYYSDIDSALNGRYLPLDTACYHSYGPFNVALKSDETVSNQQL